MHVHISVLFVKEFYSSLNCSALQCFFTSLMLCIALSISSVVVPLAVAAHQLHPVMLQTLQPWITAAVQRGIQEMMET